MPVDTDALTLSDAHVRVLLQPSWGGSIGRFDYVGRGGIEPMFRPKPEEGARRPFDSAAIVLAPWSNRISGGGFTFRGRRYDLSPNVAGEPYPIHGNAFALPWQVEACDGSQAILSCVSSGPGPYAYGARLSYAVAGGSLAMQLSVENRGRVALPFGLGFHPWLVRSTSTLLQAPAAGVWLEDQHHLPLGEQPVECPPPWRFAAPSPLPDGFINNCFVGWHGAARVQWPERRLELDITAGPALPHYILYSPGKAADFFCFEPVSHVVDAFNLPGGADANGMTVLEPGVQLAAEAHFTAREY